jgi:hypothetical protein
MQEIQDSTTVTTTGLVFLMIMAVLTVVLRRENALVPLLVTVCYMPLGQRFVIGGLHFHFFRVLLLMGICRVVLRGEAAGLRITGLDKLFLCWMVASLVLGTLVKPSTELLINRLGAFYNAAGVYFFVRFVVRDFDDVIGNVRAFALLLVPLAGCMAVEKLTGRNVFSIFGGVPDVTGIRDGTLRCQGAFLHPIMAGTFAATLFPLFIGLWFHAPTDRFRAALGIVSSAFATAAAASSGALLAFLGALAVFGLWPMRRQMRIVRWGIGFGLVAMSLLMSAPIWYLIAKISEITGGTGWHRSYLIDQAIKHFNEWWLFGTTYTAHWGPGGQVLASDPNNMDITNHYVYEGVHGGVIKLGLFTAMIVVSFGIIGRCLRRTDWRDPGRTKFLWGIGAGLFAHCVSFISVAYFDQLIVIWFWLLAVVSMLSQRRTRLTRSVKETVGNLNNFVQDSICPLRSLPYLS